MRASLSKVHFRMYLINKGFYGLDHIILLHSIGFGRSSPWFLHQAEHLQIQCVKRNMNLLNNFEICCLLKHLLLCSRVHSLRCHQPLVLLLLRFSDSWFLKIICYWKCVSSRICLLELCENIWISSWSHFGTSIVENFYGITISGHKTTWSLQDRNVQKPGPPCAGERRTSLQKPQDLL